MADDNILRTYRSNDPVRRDADVSAAADPLAELARLIGQTDPFHDAPRNEARGQTADWRQHIERPNYEAMIEQPMPPPESQFGGSAPQPPAAQFYDHDPVSDGREQHRAAPAMSPSDYSDPPVRREPQFAAAAAPSYAAARVQADDYGRVANGHREIYADEAYDDPPRRKGSSSLVTAVVLIGCAMIGTAGAYAYRTYSSPGSMAAPVITADTSPSKVVPVPPDSKATRSQERFGNSGGEKLVPREEQPVTIQPGSGLPPRVVFPPLAPSAGPPVAAANPAPPSTGSTPKDSANASEPKRVRTVTIRPDGSDPSARPVVPTEPRQQVPSAKVTPPPRPGAPPARSGQAPLSLDPSAPAAETADAPRGQPRAVPAPRDTRPAGPNLASVPSASGAGGYLVQVSSQRSEDEARSSFRSLQVKYSQLKSRQAIVRRADLGAKGTYYRAFVGPFGSAGEAGQFCDQLKSSGGQCIVVRN